MPISGGGMMRNVSWLGFVAAVQLAGALFTKLTDLIPANSKIYPARQQ
jgi:hypothetical protein